MTTKQTGNRLFIAEQLAKRPSEQFPDRVIHSNIHEKIVELQKYTFGAKTVVSQDEGAYPNPAWDKAKRRKILDLPEIEKAISEMQPYFAEIMAKIEAEVLAVKNEENATREEINTSVTREAQLREQATESVLSCEKDAKRFLELAVMETLKREALTRKCEAMQKDLAALQERYDEAVSDAAYGEWCIWEQERRRIVQETFDGIMYLYDLTQAGLELADRMSLLRRRYVGHDGSNYVYSSPGLPEDTTKNEQDKPE